VRALDSAQDQHNIHQQSAQLKNAQDQHITHEQRAQLDSTQDQQLKGECVFLTWHQGKQLM